MENELIDEQEMIIQGVEKLAGVFIQCLRMARTMDYMSANFDEHTAAILAHKEAAVRTELLEDGDPFGAVLLQLDCEDDGENQCLYMGYLRVEGPDERVLDTKF